MGGDKKSIGCRGGGDGDGAGMIERDGGRDGSGEVGRGGRVFLESSMFGDSINLIIFVKSIWCRKGQHSLSFGNNWHE